MLKQVLIFVSGVAIGAGGAYLILRKKAEGTFEEELRKTREFYSSKEDKFVEEIDALQEKIEELTKTEPEQATLKEEKPVFKSAEKPPLQSILEENGYLKKEEKADEKSPVETPLVKVNRKKKSSKPKPKKKIDYDDHYEDEDPEDEDHYNDFDHPEKVSDSPYSITPEQFTKENVFYDKAQFFYYEEDDILTDDMDEQMNAEISTTVGEDFRDHIGEYEPDVAYIRNDAMSSDYEILVQHCSFHDKILGEE